MSANSDERLSRKDLMVLLGIPLTIVVIACLLLVIWLTTWRRRAHPFDHLVSKVVSPDGKYSAEIHDEGDDITAYEACMVASVGHPDDEVDLGPVDVDRMAWKDNRTLVITYSGDLGPSEETPKEWKGIRFEFVVSGFPPGARAPSPLKDRGLPEAISKPRFWAVSTALRES